MAALDERGFLMVLWRWRRLPSAATRVWNARTNDLLRRGQGPSRQMQARNKPQPLEGLSIVSLLFLYYSSILPLFFLYSSSILPLFFLYSSSSLPLVLALFSSATLHLAAAAPPSLCPHLTAKSEPLFRRNRIFHCIRSLLPCAALYLWGGAG